MTHTERKWRVLVVGGHTRNIGKTSLVVDLIRAFPEHRWTAVKVSQHGHAPHERAAALDWETNSLGSTDTSRFLAAGASRAIWLRTKQGHLAEGLPLLRSALAEVARPEDLAPGNLILESNSLLGFLKPALYLVVLDPAHADFKDSARLYLDRANSFLLRRGFGEWSGCLPARKYGRWPDDSPRVFRGKPLFLQPLGQPLPTELRQFVSDRFFTAEPISL